MNGFPLTIRNGTNKRGKINDFIGINFEFCAFCRNFAPYLLSITPNYIIQSNGIKERTPDNRIGCSIPAGRKLHVGFGKKKESGKDGNNQ